MNLFFKKKYIGLIFFIILVDQFSKYIIKAKFNLYAWTDVIDGFFRIIYVRNSGAMWGLFSNSKSIWVPKLITALAIIALGFVIYYFLKFTGRCAWELTGMAFIIGGAFSNILDRLIQGYVVDFLDFYIGTAHWPTFNIADSFITCGVILFAISIWTDKTNKEPITEKES